MRAAGLLLACLAVNAAVAQTVVPVRPIRAQTVIGPADLALEEQATPGALTALDQAVGREARETLYPGRPVLAAQVGPPAVIERNQVVRMRFALGALAISTDGRALDRGAVGESIRVMNLSSRQIVTGEVAQDGTIEVGR